MRWFWIVSVLALFYGCGDTERPSQVVNLGTGGTPGSAPTTGGRSSTGGAKGDAGAGGETPVDTGGAGGQGGEGAVDSRVPLVEITSPSAVSDPDQGEVLLQDDVTVICRASKATASGSLAVSPSTVKIAMLDGSGKVLKEGVVATTSIAGEYSATFVISNRANGALGFRCTASDTAVMPRTSSVEISTFVDRGPMITVTSPIANEVLPLKTPVAFEFAVEPAPLAAGDQGAAVAEVTLSVLGMPVANLAPAPKRPGVYIATVDFTDPTLFPEAPNGDIPVMIAAANKRSPTAAVSTQGYTFQLDGEGPIITINRPKANAVVGPDQQLLEFTVSDTPAGVAKETVTVTLNGKAYGYGPPPVWLEKNGTYTFKFDSSMLNGSVASATINIHATDVAGNGADGDSLIVYLDDFPPIVSLDPGKVRVFVRAATPTAKPKCSVLFDPLGSGAVSDDGVPVGDFGTFRALVWDQTNQGTNQPIVRHSAANPDSVFLYLQPDPTQALLTDSNNDGTCDEVSTTDENGKELVFIHLSSVKPAGVAPNAPDDRTPELVDRCDLNTGTSAYLCSAHVSDMTYVLKHTIATGTESVVYARDPIADHPLACTGDGWEVRSLVNHAGWACLAAVAKDNAGNSGISPPLRICIDDDNVPETSPCTGIEPPTCTDGCTPPPQFPNSEIWYAPG